MARSTWSRRLPRSLTIPEIMTIHTLADARALLDHLPDDHRDGRIWRHVAKQLAGAAAGADIESVSIALRLARMIGRIPVKLGARGKEGNVRSLYREDDLG